MEMEFSAVVVVRCLLYFVCVNAGLMYVFQVVLKQHHSQVDFVEVNGALNKRDLLVCSNPYMPLSTKRKYRSLRLFFFNSTCAMKVQKRLHFHQLLPSTQNYSRTVAIHQTYRYHLTWLSL